MFSTDYPAYRSLKQLMPIRELSWTCGNQPFPSEHCLYVIGDTTALAAKIGVSSHPVRRLSSLQNGNCNPLSLRAVYCGASRAEVMMAELYIKAEFSPYLIRGEWFRLPAASMAGWIDLQLIRNAA